MLSIDTQPKIAQNFGKSDSACQEFAIHQSCQVENDASPPPKQSEESKHAKVDIQAAQQRNGFELGDVIGAIDSSCSPWSKRNVSSSDSSAISLVKVPSSGSNSDHSFGTQSPVKPPRGNDRNSNQNQSDAATPSPVTINKKNASTAQISHNFRYRCVMCYKNSRPSMVLLNCFHLMCKNCFEFNSEPLNAPSNESYCKTVCPKCNYLSVESESKKLLTIRNVPVECQSCLSEEIISRFYCSECSSNLCEKCSQFHGFVIGCQSNKLVEHSVERGFTPFKTACILHQGLKANKFCKTCNQFMCSNCTCQSVVATLNKTSDVPVSLENASSRLIGNHKMLSIKEIENSFIKSLVDQYMQLNYKIGQILPEIGCVSSNRYRSGIDRLEILQRASGYLLRLVSSRNTEELVAHWPKLHQYVSGLIDQASNILNNTDSSEQASGTVSANFDTVEKSNGSESNAYFRRTFSDSVFSAANFTETQSTVTSSRSTESLVNGARNSCYGEFILPTANNFQNDAVMKNFNKTGPIVTNELLKIPRGPIFRNKMVYKYKFGDFGTEISNFTEPSGIASDRGENLYIADTNNHRIQVFGIDGVYRMTIGGDGELLYPNRVAVDLSNGNVVVTERSPSHQIQIFDKSGRFLRRFGSKVIQHPRGLTVDYQSRIIVIECKVMRVVIFSPMGDVLFKFNCNKLFQFPNNVAVNDREEIFISDNRLHKIQVFSYKGILLRSIGHEYLINYPIGVEIDGEGNLIVADNHNNFNITVLDSQTGELIQAFESRTKHAQCYDITLSKNGELFMSSKDFRIYKYQFDNGVIGRAGTSTNAAAQNGANLMGASSSSSTSNGGGACSNSSGSGESSEGVENYIPSPPEFQMATLANTEVSSDIFGSLKTMKIDSKTTNKSNGSANFNSAQPRPTMINFVSHHHQAKP